MSSKQFCNPLCPTKNNTIYLFWGGDKVWSSSIPTAKPIQTYYSKFSVNFLR